MLATSSFKQSPKSAARSAEMPFSAATQRIQWDIGESSGSSFRMDSKDEVANSAAMNEAARSDSVRRTGRRPDGAPGRIEIVEDLQDLIDLRDLEDARHLRLRRQQD